MPLRKGKARAVIASNIEEMVRAGHPRNQAVAAALRSAGQARPAKAKKARGRT